VLFYHSNAERRGVAGVARVCSEAYPDHTAWDAADPHFDPKASPENPIWIMVDIEIVEKFPHFVPLDELRSRPELAEMLVLRRGMRLSVQPVRQEDFELVRALGHP
jgi:predicted RNA-binding protein with PUA-like domain